VADWLQQFGLNPDLQRRLLSTLLIVGGLLLLRRLSLAVVYRRYKGPWARYRWRKGTTYVAVIVGVILVGRLWVAGIGALATFFGLLSAGLAIALKDVVANFAGWAYIVWRRPFEVGDRIQIGQHAGDVIDIGIFQCTLNEIGVWVQADQSTGRLVHVPNGRVLADPVANYHQGFPYLWHEIPVQISFESNWRKAKEILTRIAARHAEHLTAEAERNLLEASRKYLIAYAKLTPIVYTKVVEDGVRLTIRYLIEPRRRRGTEQAIWEDILDEFNRAPDIAFGYITRRGYNNQVEGKLALRADSLSETTSTDAGAPKTPPVSSLPPAM
jgi:small-conductance mechanosensitive channel